MNGFIPMEISRKTTSIVRKMYEINIQSFIKTIFLKHAPCLCENIHIITFKVCYAWTRTLKKNELN
jgi:hypothetical protein